MLAGFGGPCRNRTGTSSRTTDFKSVASTNSAKGPAAGDGRKVGDPSKRRKRRIGGTAQVSSTGSAPAARISSESSCFTCANTASSTPRATRLVPNLPSRLKG